MTEIVKEITTEPTIEELITQLTKYLSNEELSEINNSTDFTEALQTTYAILLKKRLNPDAILLSKGILLQKKRFKTHKEGIKEKIVIEAIQNATRAQVSNILTRTGEWKTTTDENGNLHLTFDPTNIPTERLRSRVLKLFKDPTKKQQIIQIFKDYKDLPQDFELQS